jgi:hypothetical protein
MAPLLSIATALTPLVLLACPVSMGAMMYFMMRGSSGGKRQGHAPSDIEATSVDDLKAEHARLGDQIEQLQRSDSSDRTPAER